MRIRVPIHSVFLENNDEVSVSDGYEKATKKIIIFKVRLTLKIKK